MLLLYTCHENVITHMGLPDDRIHQHGEVEEPRVDCHPVYTWTKLSPRKPDCKTDGPDECSERVRLCSPVGLVLWLGQVEESVEPSAEGA